MEEDSIGTGSSFGCSNDLNMYAFLDGMTKVRVYKNFKKRTTLVMNGSDSWAVGGESSWRSFASFGVFWDREYW